MPSHIRIALDEIKVCELGNDLPSCGLPPAEKSYAEACDLSFSNVLGQMDAFVLAHILGWYGKSIIIRDYWACWMLSVLFEMCEYSLEHHLPNFLQNVGGIMYVSNT